jgi:hypothetical protein
VVFVGHGRSKERHDAVAHDLVDGPFIAARRLAPDGLASWAQVIERGYEGWATRRWLKVKQKNWTVEEDRRQRRMFGEDR